MRNILNVIFLLGLMCSSLTATINSSVDPTSPSRPLNSRAGNCIQGQSTIYLDANNVRALLLLSGDLWWDRTNSAYEVPRRTDQQILNKERFASPLFNGAVWISGKTGGNLKMAAITYSGGRQSFWPGPIIDKAAEVRSDRCSRFDNFWKVTSDEIKAAIDYNKTGKGEIPKSIKEWPGKGNPFLISSGKLTSQDLQEELAPFYDVNNDCIYDATKGDLPSIYMASNGSCASTRCNDFVYADQMIFWVINDVGNIHVGPAASPIGVQLNCLAFAFKSSDELNDMTFYTYDIWNKSNVTLEETYMTQYMDADLGNFSDDYIGCDTTRSLGYIYNADPDDQTGQTVGYGTQPPIFGADFFEGPKKNGKPIGMSSFLYYLNCANANNCDPSTDIHFRNYQEGKNRAGQSLTVSNTCFEPGGTPTKYCYYGDPAKTTEWSMCKGNAPIATGGDYRWLQNSGPFDMSSGSVEKITVGAIFVRPPTGSQNGCIPVMSYLRDADDKAQRLFDACFKVSPGPDAPEVKIIESSNALYFSLYNIESSNNYGENYNEKSLDIPISSWNKDTTYKFEGYAVYQIVSENAISGLDDLKDPNKAKLVVLMDVRNNVTKGVSFSEEIINGTLVTNIKQSLILPNTGLTRDFKVDRDLFQFEKVGDLVNNKTYYYATVAFAFNNYRDPRPNTNDYQKNQLKFSNSVKIFKGTPHNNDFWGVKAKTEYFQPIDVKRISGQGHGRYFLDLVAGEETKILAQNKLDELIYQGGKSPISVMVNDPFKVRNAKFKLTMLDTSLTQNPDKYRLDSSYWKLDIMERDSAGKIIYSEGTLDREFNQSIYTNVNNYLKNYGITVGQSYANKVGTVNRNGNTVYDYIDASISYKDSSKQWLNLINDKDKTDYEDWIRTGTLEEYKYAASYNIIGTTKVFTDPDEKFSKILGGAVAPYCLAANTNVLASLPENNYQSYAPGFKWKRVTADSASAVNTVESPENNLDSIFSFDLVITPEKKNWSKCIVFETGESDAFTEGNALKGQIRKAASLNANFEPQTDTGMSYFPGYVINLETGVRMNVAFGENSRFRGKGGANMMWDPDTLMTTPLGNPIIGGSHFVYVMNTEYSEQTVESDAQFLLSRFNNRTGGGLTQTLNTGVGSFYRKLAWTFVPLTKSPYSLYNSQGNFEIPTEVRIKVRVEKPYAKYLSPESVYEFSTEGMQFTLNNDSLRHSAFDRTTIVPNPYYAFSAYELNATQNIVKIINVPVNSTVSIYTTDGMLVRKFKLDGANIGDGYYGGNSETINYDNSIDWDLRTTSGVLIASGVYYVNIDAGNLGNKVLKLFAVMRSADVSNF